jgi:hypothetical protein
MDASGGVRPAWGFDALRRFVGWKLDATDFMEIRRMKGNWVKLHRKLLANSIMSHDGLSRLWLYCLLKANWKDRKWLITGTTEEINVPRGSFVTGRSKLHTNLYGPKYKGDKRTIPSDRTLWRWLKSLEKMGCVRVQNVSNRFSMVSVCKYSTYQKLDDPKCPTSGQPLSSSCPTDVPLVSTSKECIKEGVKKEEELNTFSLTPDAKKIPEPPRATQQANAGLMPIPDVLNLEPFKSYWFDSWLPYLRAKDLHGRDPPNETLKQQLIYLAPLGPSSAVDVLKTSVANQWRGVKPPNDNQKPQANKRTHTKPDEIPF